MPTFKASKKKNRGERSSTNGMGESFARLEMFSVTGVDYWKCSVLTGTLMLKFRHLSGCRWLSTSKCRSFREPGLQRAHTSGEHLGECLLWSFQTQRGVISGISSVKMGLRHILFHAAGSPYEEGIEGGLLMCKYLAFGSSPNAIMME